MSSSSQRKKPSATPGKGTGRSGKPGMPILLIGGGALLLILAAVFIYTSRQPTTPAVPLEVRGAAALKVDQERIDFGDVKVDTPVTATFILSNVGDRGLAHQRSTQGRSRRRVLTAASGPRFDGPQARREHPAFYDLHHAQRHGRHARFPRENPIQRPGAARQRAGCAVQLGALTARRSVG